VCDHFAGGFSSLAHADERPAVVYPNCFAAISALRREIPRTCDTTDYTLIVSTTSGRDPPDLMTDAEFTPDLTKAAASEMIDDLRKQARLT
jgi:hypothetical protein